MALEYTLYVKGFNTLSGQLGGPTTGLIGGVYYTGYPTAPTATVSGTTIPTITGIDPTELANATYGKVIPIFVGGKARLGGSIIAGPYFNTINSVLCATFGISFAFAANPTGTRVLFEIALDSKVVWQSAAGTATVSSGTFLNNTFTARFYQGTFTQSADPIETEKWGSNAVAYRPQICLFFENLPLTDYQNKIPFVAALIGDTTDGADPSDGINLGDMLERLAYSPWVGMTTNNFETDGIEDIADAAIFAEDQSFLDMLENFNRVYRNWNVTQTDKLRVVDRGANLVPDLVLDRDRVLRGPVTYQRQEPGSIARELELITIDPDADYMMLPGTAKRPREPYAVSGSSGKEVMTLPIVLNAETRQALVTYVKFAEERSRKRVTLTGMPIAMRAEPGDIVAVEPLIDGLNTESFKCIETLHGANHTVRMTLESVMGCPLWFPPDPMVWFRGNDLTGANGSTIALWEDASGNGYNATQSTEANKPTVAASALNGMNVVRFTKADKEHLLLPSLENAASSVSVFYVVKAINDPEISGEGGPLHVGGSSNTNHYPFTDSSIYNDDGSTVRKTVGNPTPALTDWNIVSVVSAANDWKYFLNGAELFSTGTNTVGLSGNPVLGSGSGGGDPDTFNWDGYMAEFVLVGEAMSVTDREKMEGYLAHKWGISSVLDSGHTYKSSPPSL